MTSQDYGAFVIALLPLIRREATRLAREGVPIDIEDAVQTVVLWLLEREEKTEIDTSSVSIRHRIIDLLVKPATASKRRAFMVRIEDGAGAALTVPSHEDEVVDRVTAEELAELMPQTAATRQARGQMTKRWIDRVKAYVTREAA